MTIVKNPVVMTSKDHKLLSLLVQPQSASVNEQFLAEELKRSIIVTEEAFPPHAIRLNSKVSILDLATQDVVAFSIVMPEQADSRKNLISILTPLGVALIGFRKAEEVHYKSPGGLKRYRILDVDNTAWTI